MKEAGFDLEPKEFDSLAQEPQEAQGRITAAQGPVEMRDFDDPVAIRKNIFRGVKDAFAQKVMENKEHVLRFADVDYDTPGDFTISDEKKAVLSRRRLYWNLKGRMQLLDKATGAVISEDAKPRKLAEVPYVTRRGTFIHNGTEYLTAHQMRLKPGAYTRVQNNGDVETQFNVLKGSSFRVHMTPETGVFRMQAGQAQMKLYPILKAMGIEDKALLEAWGKDLFNANKAADDKTEGATVQKLVQRLGGHLDQELSPEDAAKRLPEIFKRMELDPEVMRRTLGKAHANVDQGVILDATRKILRVHKGAEDPDDRDDLPYQSFHGPEDFFREHVEKDAGQYIRQALWKAGFKKDVQSIPENYFTKQLQSILLGSGLSSSLTEINPAEIYDMRHKITRMGEGGIGSSDVVPKGARGVQPTHFGFIDPLRAPESQNIALDLRTTQGTKVGSDGRLYQQFMNPKTGALEYLHTDAAADKIIAFPGELEKAQGNPKQKVRAMVHGKMSYIPAAKVDYELPHASGMWSPLTWMVPFMSGVKGARVGMGARMQSQALALKEPEAPLVMSLHKASGKGFNEHIGGQMGAVRSKQPGVVKTVTPDGIEVQHQDGTTEVYETYNNLPFNQKGFIHNTPVVKPGQPVGPGDLLARSNYTDDKGRSAIGKNVTAAWHMLDGLTHEDAIAISETAAKKFASEQMYEFSKEKGDDIHEISKNAYISQFPSIYTQQQIDRMDDDGVVVPGTILKQGDPIILAVGKQNQAIRGSIMKGRKSSFNDAAETWDHEADAEVVDVQKTQKGPVVTLKSYTPMKPGDKLSGLFGNKGVVSKIIPDSEMLQTSDGKAVDIVMNPMGIISRVNPASLAEAALGKVARRTGKSYVVDGFPKHSIAQFALDELAKNGMSDTETIIDPKTGRHIRDVFVGVPYVMKLHHMSEGKMGARETAHYTMDDLPAKGGAEGCFVAKQRVLTSTGWERIANICEKRKAVQVQTYSEELREWVWRPVTDWFTYRAKVADIRTVSFVAPSFGERMDWAVQCFHATPNHEVFLFSGEKVLAGDLKVGQELVTWGVQPTRHQWEFMYGTLLGDASLRSGNLFAVEHSVKQVEYVTWKHGILSSLGATWRDIDREPSESSVAKESGRIRSRRVEFYLPHVQEELQRVCECNGEKRVTAEWLSKLSGLSVAAWLLDDGCLTNASKKKGKVAYAGAIATHGFAVAEVELLVEWLSQRYGPFFKRCPNNSIYISASAVPTLIREIARWVPWSVIPGSKQFLIRQVREIQETLKPERLECTQGLSKVPMRIHDIRPYRHDKEDVEEINVYDFTVADTHTYVAGGALVSNSKRFGFMEIMGLMAHGVPHFVQDAKLTRGQRNDDFWRMYRMGITPATPRISKQYHKFETMLQGAGVSLRKKDGSTQIFPATQKEIEALGGAREVTSGDTVDFDTGEPIKGGLFDVATTGGQGGEHWSHVKLAEPMPNPLMEDPFRSLLGLTKDKYREILSGREALNGAKGPHALKQALENFNLPREILSTTEEIKAGKRSARDRLVKRLGFLKAFERLEAHPRDFFLTQVPVLPPKFRPVSKFKETTISADANFLYKDLIEANENLKGTKEAFGDDNVADTRLQAYDAFKAVVGLGNPIQPETQERNVRGLLKQIVGTSPKYGNFQRRVIGNPVDFVGRSVIIPGNHLDIDEVGLPVDMMWTLFKPFTIRKLSRAGMPMQKALQEWKQRTPQATQALMAEAARRPVVINRAPTLHKYNLTGHFAKPVAGHAMQLSNLILKGHNADYDGDALNIHVPIGDRAVDDVKEKMLPSKMLYSTKAFDVHMLPDQGFVTGLFVGSHENKKRKTRTFASKADAVKAYRSGEIDVDDPIVILRGT